MESVTIKMEPELLKEIDDNLTKNRYATRTEFIRDALRDKLEKLDIERRKEGLMKLKGSVKKIKHFTKDEMDKHAEEFLRQVKNGRDYFKEVGL